ncbi:MAG: hypothetical protein IJR89_03850 [Clostridia bacterium]|nr:hypothetical protein [Clostridia bacterium]
MNETNEIRRRPSRGAQRAQRTSEGKKRFSLFWTIPLFLLLLAGLFLFALNIKVKTFLREYEEVQPKYVAEEIYQKYFSPLDIKAILRDAAVSYKIGEEEITKPTVSPFETEADMENYLKGLVGEGELSYSAISTGVSAEQETVKMNFSHLTKYFVDTFNAKGDLRYIVKVGDKKVAEFTLSHTGKKSRSGYDQYGFSSLFLYAAPHESVTVYAPLSSKVTLNGVPLGEEYRLPDVYEKTDSAEHLEKPEDGVVYVAYYLEGLFNKVTTDSLKVTDLHGQAQPVVYDEEKNLFSAELVYREDLRQQYADYVIHAIERYSARMQNDGAISEFAAYFDQNSDLWGSIREQGWSLAFVWEHKGYNFTEQKAEDFYAYNDHEFSCHVSMLHTLIGYNNQLYTDHVDFIVYLHKVDGQYLIYDWVTSSGGMTAQ